MPKRLNGDAPPKESAPKQPLTTAHIIKVAVCAVLFLGAMVLFSFVCRQAENNYLMILIPKIDTTVSWLLQLSLCTLLLSLMIGVIIVLERPFWLDAVLFLLAAAIFILVNGAELAVLVVAAAFFLFLLLHSSLAVQQFKNQINFSMHPLSDRNLLFFSVLTLLVAAAFSVGVQKDMARRNYVVAPEIRDIAVNFLFDQTKSMVLNKHLTPAKEKVALDEMRNGVQNFVDESLIKPVERIADKIPYILGVMIFLILQLLFWVLSFVYLLLAKIFIGILRATHFAVIQMETREVKHIAI